MPSAPKDPVAVAVDKLIAGLHRELAKAEAALAAALGGVATSTSLRRTAGGLELSFSFSGAPAATPEKENEPEPTDTDPTPDEPTDPDGRLVEAEVEPVVAVDQPEETVVAAGVTPKAAPVAVWRRALDARRDEMNKDVHADAAAKVNIVELNAQVVTPERPAVWERRVAAAKAAAAQAEVADQRMRDILARPSVTTPIRKIDLPVAAPAEVSRQVAGMRPAAAEKDPAPLRPVEAPVEEAQPPELIVEAVAKAREARPDLALTIRPSADPLAWEVVGRRGDEVRSRTIFDARTASYHVNDLLKAFPAAA